MSKPFSVTLPSGEQWTPSFVTALDDQKCIGCGRCFKVCSRGVLEPERVNDFASPLT